MDIFKLRTFYQVARLGSLTLAAKQLNYSIPNVSRQLVSLEEYLNIRLFTRTNNKLTLTPQGEMLFRRAIHILNEIDGVKNLLQDDHATAAGLLHISTLRSLASPWLAPYLKGFLNQYPDMRLIITSDDTKSQLFLEDADVAIGPRIPEHPDLIQVHLATSYWELYASEEYLKQFGTPTTVEDLDGHRLITRTETGNLPYKIINWLLTIGREDKSPREPYLRINSVNALIELATDGMGIVALPHIIKHVKQGKLVNILPHINAPSIDVTYIYPKALKDSKRITCLKDYLVEALAKDNS